MTGTTDQSPAKTRPRFDTVAVVGTGVIGRSWAAVFARAGCHTRLYDADASQRQRAIEWLDEDIGRDVEDGFTTEEGAAAQRAHLETVDDLGAALAGAQYVQESGPEILEAKQSLYADLGAASAPETILASSTSTMDINDIAGHLPCADRSIVAHPVNPPHVVPVVEVLPGDKTTSEVTESVQAFLHEIGQTPVRLNFYLPGFLLNRMQAALVREAINLLDCGVADADAIDAVIRDGLGLRWALMGPFGVANTNHDAGVRGYFTTFRDAYAAAWNDLSPSPTVGPDLVERMGLQTDAMTHGAQLPDIRRWRDRLVRKIRRLKESDPHP